MKISRVDENGWAKREIEIEFCDLCEYEAVWFHPIGGKRCYTCPRPGVSKEDEKS